MSYIDTQKKIESTLTGRPSGTQITPDSHQGMEEELLEYVRQVENIIQSPLEGIADTSTVPVQPDAANVCYIAGVNSNTTKVFNNFVGQDGSPISVTAGADPLLVTLFWNKKYWNYLTTLSAPHFDIKKELGDTDDAVSQKAVTKALQEVYKKSNPNDEQGNIIDTNTLWSIKGNEQFIAAIIDPTGKFVLGFEKSDGNCVFANGVPKAIQEAINKAVKEREAVTAELSRRITQEGTDRSRQYATLIKTVNDEIKNRQDSENLIKQAVAQETKERKQVDSTLETKDNATDKYKRSNPQKEDGAVVDTYTVLKIKDNNTYIIALVDSNERVVLGFEQKDGNAVFANGVPRDIQHAIDNVNISLAARITLLELARLNPHIVLSGSDIVEFTNNPTVLAYNGKAVTNDGDVSVDSNFTDIQLSGWIKYASGQVTLPTQKAASISGNYSFSSAQQATLMVLGNGKYKGSNMTFATVSKIANCVKPAYIGYSDVNTTAIDFIKGQKIVKKSLAGLYNVTNQGTEPQYLFVAIPKNGNVDRITSIVQHSTMDAPQQFTVVDATEYTLYVCNTRHNPGTYNFILS